MAAERKSNPRRMQRKVRRTNRRARSVFGENVERRSLRKKKRKKK